jgi:hypothetical protein
MAVALRARHRTAVLLALTLIAQACDAPRVDGPPPTVTASFAKAAVGPSVAAAVPASGHQGDVTLDVTITGSGFDNGSRVSWQLNGVPYEKISVNSTRFNSASSLTANITISADAAATTYDIAVVTTTGKKGIGAELFTVTYAISLTGVTEGRAITDAGYIVGYNGTAVVTSSPGGGTVTVATSATVWDVDRGGFTIGGKDAAERSVIWESPNGAAGPWAVTVLPDLGSGGAVRGIASDASGHAVFLAGNAYSADAKRHPVVWKRTTGGWELQVNQTPIDVASIFAQAVNARGQSVGFDGSGCCTAAYWDSSGAATRLAGLAGARNAAAWAINGDGTIAVGNSGVSAVLWRRTLSDGVYGPWSGAVALENTPTLCGKSGSSVAYDINSAGTVAVGMSCGVATAWTITGGVVTGRQLLQGLGPPNQSVAYGVSDTSAPLATGSAKSATGVYWWGF